MDDNACKAVPLVEQLRSVPTDAVLRIDTPNALGCMDTRSIPVGRLCHEAAAALDAATPASTTGSAVVPEQQVYTVDDEGLQELLNHVSFLQFAADTGVFLGHDDVMGFLMALEKIEVRLNSASGGSAVVPAGEAPLSRCTACGRKSWDAEETDQLCAMPQPGGEFCHGTMVAAGPASGAKGGSCTKGCADQQDCDLSCHRGTALGEGAKHG